MASAQTKKRPLGFIKVLLLCALVGLVAGGVSAILSTLGLLSGPIGYAGAVLAAGAVAMWLCWKWWLGVDEAVREAHKWSWFWGGSTALIFVGALALGLFSIAQGDAAEQFGVTREEASLLFTGMITTVLMLLAGYGLFWAGWWLARSR